MLEVEELHPGRDKSINSKPVVRSSVGFACDASGKLGVEDLMIDCNESEPREGFEVVNGNVRRIALQPARRVAAPVVVDGGGG